MYNKKCISTFLFCLALINLITLILPFVNVNFFGDVSTILKILYFVTISIFGVGLVLIIIIGVFNFFKNDFSLVPVQEFISYVCFVMLLINVIIFLPVNNANLTLGFSILFLESFVMAFTNDFIRSLQKLPRTIKSAVENLKNKERLKNKNQENEKNEDKIETKFESIKKDETIDEDEVKIIPPNENDEII